MNRRHFLRGFCITAASLLLAGCWGGTYEWNQKVTVVVSTPSGEKSGSAVSRIINKDGPFFASASGVDVKMQGEATVVEVLPGKFLFAVISEDSKSVAKLLWPYQLEPAEKWPLIQRKRGSVELLPKLYPMLVTFDDINDPKSVKLVDPANLSASFGPGVALKSIAFEITDDALTVGVVEKAIPWVVAHKGRLKEIPVPTPKGYVPLLEEEIYRGNFVRRSKY